MTWLISNPGLTLFYAEFGCCQKGCPDNTLTVIGLFKDRSEFRGEMARRGGFVKVAVWKQMLLVWWNDNQKNSLF